MAAEISVDLLLQPLRIPPGRQVNYNIFTHFDPGPENAEFFYGSCLFTASSRKDSVGVELTFVPEGDPNGEYVLDFHRGPFHNPETIRQMRSRDRLAIVSEMERFFSYRE